MCNIWPPVMLCRQLVVLKTCIGVEMMSNIWFLQSSLLWRRQGGRSLQDMAFKCQCAVHISCLLRATDMDRSIGLGLPGRYLSRFLCADFGYIFHVPVTFCLFEIRNHVFKVLLVFHL